MGSLLLVEEPEFQFAVNEIGRILDNLSSRYRVKAVKIVKREAENRDMHVLRRPRSRALALMELLIVIIVIAASPAIAIA